MKKHKVTPLESMQLEFLDRTLIFTFDMQAITKMQNEFGALEDVARKYTEFELAAMMLWAGVKHEDFTLDEAKVIITSSAEVLSDTLTLTMDSIMHLAGEKNEKKLLEEIERAVKKVKV
ncbi:MAG: hypothetical protein E7231_00435 [Cellulosilyticum sp.]|nr:hypothetical protein [Cellulosilyticum sp.]